MTAALVTEALRSTLDLDVSDGAVLAVGVGAQGPGPSNFLQS
jgi:hypothetical protein